MAISATPEESQDLCSRLGIVKENVSTELLEFLTEHFSHINEINGFDTGGTETPLSLAIRLGKVEIAFELMAFIKPEELVEFLNSKKVDDKNLVEYFSDQISKHPNVALIRSYIAFLNASTSEWHKGSSFNTLLAALFDNSPLESDKENFEQWLIKIKALEENFDKSIEGRQGYLYTVPKIIADIITKKNRDDLLKYITPFIQGNTITSGADYIILPFKVISLQLAESKGEDEKKRSLKLLNWYIKEVYLKELSVLESKMSEEDRKGSKGNLKSSITRSMRQCVFIEYAIQNTDENLFKLLMNENIFDKGLITLENIVSIFESPKKAFFLNELKPYIGDDKEMVNVLLEDIQDKFYHNKPPGEKDFIKIMKLPLFWTKEQETQLFDNINKSSLITHDNKVLLKRLFRETKGKDKKQDVEKRWQDLNSPKMLLDTTLFSNIHNDPNLQGSNLQGVDMTRTLRYVSHLITRLEEQSITIPGLSSREQRDYVSQLIQFKNKLIESLRIKEIIAEHLNNPKMLNEETRDENVAKMQAEISTYIWDSLLKNGSFLMPGGWMGLNQRPGHAMLYEFKIIDGAFVLLIHNTGAGIGHHLQKDLADRRYYSSIKAYRFKADELKASKESFSSLIANLTKPNFEPAFGDISYNEEKVYDLIENSMKELSGSEIDPGPFSKEWISPQLSGTCTVSVIRSLGKNFPFPDNFAYADFDYEMLRISLSDFFDANKDNLNDSTIQRVMNTALENFSRELSRISEKIPPLLNKERIKVGIELVQTIGKALRNAVKLSPEEEARERILPRYYPETVFKPEELFSTRERRPLLTQSDREVDISPQDTINANLDNPLDLSPIEAKEIKPWDIKEADDCLNDLLAECSSYENTYSRKVLRTIEQYFTTLPLDKASFSSLSKDQLARCINSLQHLQYLYSQSIKNVDAIPTPERQMTLLTIEFIAFNMFSCYYEDNPILVQKMAGEIWKKNVGLFSNALKSPYFINLNKETRERKSVLEKAFNAITAKYDEIYYATDEDLKRRSYIHQIVLSHPDEKKILLEIYERFVKEERESPGSHTRFDEETISKLEKMSEDERAAWFCCYYSYMHIKRNEFESSCPQIAKDLSLALQVVDIVQIATFALEDKLNFRRYYTVEMAPLDFLDYRRDIEITQSDEGQYYTTLNSYMAGNYRVATCYSLSESVANIKDPLIKEILETRSKSSNEIQVGTIGEILTEKDLLLRNLKNIRLKPEVQVIQTVDFMKRSFGRLIDPDIQVFMLLSLLEEPLLEQQLMKTPNLLMDIAGIIERGIKTYEKEGKLDPAILFFLKLGLSLSQIITNLSKTETSKERLGIFKNFLARVDKVESKLNLEWIPIIQERVRKNPKDELSKAILRECHVLNIIRLESKDADIQLLPSYFHIQNTPKNQFYDPFFERWAKDAYAKREEQIRRGIEYLYTSGKSNDLKTLSNILNDLLREQGISIPSSKVKWQIEFPWANLISSDDSRALMHINLLRGNVAKDKTEKILIPQDISQKPLFRSFFNRENMEAFVDPNKEVYELDYNGAKYRFLCKQYYHDTIQREMKLPGFSGWYEYFLDSKLDIPFTLKDRNHKQWVSLNKNSDGSRDVIIVDSKTDQPRYVYEAQKKTLFEIDKNGKKTGFYLLNQKTVDSLLKYIPNLEQFEDKQFLTIFKCDSPSEIRIHLSRYNLAFKATLDKDGRIGPLISLEDPRYQLITDPKHEFIPGFDAALWYVPTKEAESQNLSDKVLIPEKFYLATTGEEGEFYRLEFDKGNALRTKILKNKEKHSEGDELQIPYQGSERCFSFSLTPTMGLKTDSIQGKLYLAYLYLAKRQPLVANDILSSILDSSEPLKEEDLEALRKIIYEIPAKTQGGVDQTTLENEAQIDSPEFVATRALAFSILVREKLEGREIKFENIKAEVTGEQRPDIEYRMLRQEQLKEFWSDKNMSSKLMNFMHDYLIKKQHMPTQVTLESRQITLDESKELDILRYIMLHQKDPKKSGPEKTIPVNVRFRRRQLELNALVREKNRLEELRKRLRGQLPPEYARKLEFLENRLENYPKVEVIEPIYTEVGALPSRGVRAVAVPKPRHIERIIELEVSGKTFTNLVQSEQDSFVSLFQSEVKKLKSVHNSEDAVNKLFKPKESKELALMNLRRDAIQEYRAGLSNNLELKARAEASHKYYQQYLAKDKGEKLSRELAKTISKGNQELEELKKKILAWANKEPSDPEKRGEWALKRSARAVRDIKFEEILRLFLNRDLSLFEAQSALTEKEVVELQRQVFDYLNQATLIQYYERLSKPLLVLKKEKSTDEEINASIEEMGMLLSMKRQFDPKEHPEILLFEYLENKLLYREQYLYLKDLMQQDKETFKSEVIKLIMGGGKSKVLLPILSLKKANGNNLVILEVPDSLYEINRRDLNATTQRLFGCSANSFHFDESVKCTPKYFLNLKRKLKSIIRKRKYLISTRESFQALELKYLKMLRYGDLKDKDTRIMLKHMADILRILKNQGDFLIDEVDTTLDVRKQLIHPVGKTRRVSVEIAEANYNLFQFIDKLTLTIGEKENISFTLKQIIHREKVPREDEWNIILYKIANKLVNEKESPLYSLIEPALNKLAKASKKNLELEKDAIVFYLLGDLKQVPKSISMLKDEEKEIIALYKCQLETLLKMTLTKKPNINCGKTHDPSKPIELRDIAIPYSAKDTPSEKSRFKNPLETINYTLIVNYDDPISKETFRRMISKFRTEQTEEMKRGLFKGDMTAGPRFKKITGLDLDSDFDNEESFNKFYSKIQFHPEVKKYCMVNLVLTNIEENEEYLASNAHNHCGQGRSIQGMTGTDWNKRCLPKFIDTKQALEGSDGQIKDYLVRDAVPPHLLSESSQMGMQTIQTAIKLLASHPERKEFHAWIDLGSHFKGVSNLQVAEGFANYFKKGSDFKHIEYILYFENDGRPYALSKETGAKISLEETSPEYIQTRLGVGPDKYFVYYDQSRTTGTDIKQAKKAKAFVTVAAETLSRDLLQAVMRMRELRDKQRVELVILKECQDLHPEIKPGDWNVSTVIEMCEEVQAKRLTEDHFRAAIMEMKQLIRNDFFERILQVHDIDFQRHHIEHFHKAFFSQVPKSLFEEYGVVKNNELVSVILNEQAEKLIENWSKMLKSSGLYAKHTEKLLREKMQIIIDSTVPFANKETEKPALTQEADGGQFETEVQVETTETAEKTEEHELDYSRIAGAEPAPQKDLEDLSTLTLENAKITFNLLTLEEVVASSSLKTKEEKPRIEARGWKFSPNVLVSRSFAENINGQADYLDAYVKDNVFQYWQYTPDDQEFPLKVVLITPEEAEKLGKTLTSTERMQCWIETSHQTVLGGEKPERLPLEYNLMMDQIALFNGDTDILLQHLMETKDRESWLADDSLSKINFLERVILPLHTDKADLTQALYHETKKLLEVERKIERQSSRGMLTRYKTPIREQAEIKTEIDIVQESQKFKEASSRKGEAFEDFRSRLKLQENEKILSISGSQIRIEGVEQGKKVSHWYNTKELYDSRKPRLNL